MKAVCYTLLSAGLALTTASEATQASNPITSEDEVIYKTIYGQKIEAAKQSRTTEDDKALASEMMSFSQTIPNDIGVQCLIYIDAITLAASSADIRLMRDAADSLNKLWPDHKAASAESLIERANRAYLSAPRSIRQKIGEDYISLLLHESRKAEASKDIDRATTLTRKANSIARSIGSKQKANILKMLDRLTDESALIDRLKRLELSVTKNPQNTPAAFELVDLLMTRRNDPTTAAKYVTLSRDKDLIQIVELAAKGIEKAAPLDAMRVGDWYLSHAENESKDRHALMLLKNAKNWYTRFFSTYSRRDALAKKVESNLTQVQSRLDDLAETLGGTSDGDGINLIKSVFKPGQHTLGNPVIVKQGGVTIDQSSIVLPVNLNSSYELRMPFTVNSGNEDTKSAFIMHLPVGEVAATLRYEWRGELVTWLDETKERHYVDGRNDQVGQLIHLTLQVAIQDKDQVEIGVIIEDKKVLHWRGQTAKLRHDKRNAPPAELGPGIRLTCPSNTTFHKLELRTIKD